MADSPKIIFKRKYIIICSIKIQKTILKILLRGTALLKKTLVIHATVPKNKKRERVIGIQI
jgi:hypothetical protein